MEIAVYRDEYKDDVISLILGIQNDKAGIGLSLQEQPDLLDIPGCYRRDGGEFWIALADGRLIGTIGLMPKGKDCAVLKKFFVKKEFRSQGVGLALYGRLLEFAGEAGIRRIILDTPSVAHASHRFYEAAGFHRIGREELPVPYSYPDRDSILYRLDLQKRRRTT